MNKYPTPETLPPFLVRLDDDEIPSVGDYYALSSNPLNKTNSGQAVTVHTHPKDINGLCYNGPASHIPDRKCSFFEAISHYRYVATSLVVLSDTDIAIRKEQLM